MQLLLFVLLLVSCAPPVSGERVSSQSAALTATSSTSCGAYPGATCLRVTSDCVPGAPYTASVVVNPPVGAQSGLVLMIQGSGGSGIPSGPQWDPLVSSLTAAGRKVVRIGGLTGQSWEQGGVAAGSCRVAEIVAWAKAAYGAAGPYCALGSSGGSSALAGVMALHDGAGLDGIVMANGAPLTDLTCGCAGSCGAQIANACPGAAHLLAYPAGTAAGVDSWLGTSTCGTASPSAADLGIWKAEDEAFDAGSRDWGPRAVAVTCAGTAVAHGHLEMLHASVDGIARTCVSGCTGEAVLSYAPGRSAVLSAVLACGTP